METNIISLVTALTIGALIATCAVAPVRDVMISTQAKATADNLRMIEQAKRQFYELNGKAPTVEELAFFFPDCELPKPLREGEIYENLTSLEFVASSSFNGNEKYEPWGRFGPLNRNGFNDLGNTRPIRDTRFVPVIYVQAPPASTICDLPAVAQTR